MTHSYAQTGFNLWVTDRYRVLFVIDHDVIVSLSIGPHGIVSK
jgi:hypothetical protein